MKRQCGCRCVGKGALSKSLMGWPWARRREMPPSQRHALLPVGYELSPGPQNHLSDGYMFPRRCSDPAESPVTAAITTKVSPARQLEIQRACQCATQGPVMAMTMLAGGFRVPASMRMCLIMPWKPCPHARWISGWWKWLRVMSKEIQRLVQRDSIRPEVNLLASLCLKCSWSSEIICLFLFLAKGHSVFASYLAERK